MTFAAWLSLFMVSVLGAISPGPSLAVVAKNTLGGSKLNGILTAWSHAMGIGVYALLTMLGLAVILKKFPTIFLVISFAGAIYLAWIGVNALRSKGGVAAKLSGGKAMRYRESMRDGLMISLLNPKIGLFFIALFSQFIHAEVGVGSKILTVMTPLVTDGLWYTIIALTLSQPKLLSVLRDKAVWVDRATGVVLITVALRIVWVNVPILL